MTDCDNTTWDSLKGFRMKQERKQRKISRKRSKELFGIAPSTLQKYEDGLSEPPNKVMERMRIHGFDMKYINTGVRKPRIISGYVIETVPLLEQQGDGR